MDSSITNFVGEIKSREAVSIFEIGYSELSPTYQGQLEAIEDAEEAFHVILDWDNY